MVNNMKNAIEIKDLVKEYKKGFKLGPISVDVPKGQIIGLIGENGSGKTTLIKTIIGALKPNEGDIRVFDNSIASMKSYIYKDVGVVLDGAFFPELLNANEIALTLEDFYEDFDDDLFRTYLKKFKLDEKKSIKSLSKGMKKKLEIAVALAHKPKLLILDEPSEGLDPVVRNEILEEFLNFVGDEEHTILLSTHITSDLEHIADRIVFLNKGQIILNEESDTLLEDYGILKCSKEDFRKIKDEDIIKYKKGKYNYEVLVKNRDKNAKKYKDFVIDKITLDDLMVLLIKGEKL